MVNCCSLPCANQLDAPSENTGVASWHTQSMAARQALGELDLQPYMYSMYRLFKTTMLRNNMLRQTYHKEQPGP